MLALETPPDTGPPALVETRPVRLLFETAKKSIAQARAEGFRVPEDENREEFHPDPNERLGWYWAYSPTAVETMEERAARYLGDTRIIPMKAFARIVLRGYRSIKDLNFESDTSRDILAEHQQGTDGPTWTRVAEKLLAEHKADNLDDAKALALRNARKQLLKAMPARLTTAGISPIWHVSAAITWGRKTGRLDDWYQYAQLRSPGRPVGAKTRKRRAA